MIADERTTVARVEEVSMAITVAALAVAVGVASTLTSVSPTGSAGTDAIVTFVATAFVAWAGASAPWWLIAGGGTVATIGTAFGPWMVPAITAVALAALVAFSVAPLPWVRVVAVGCIVVALLHLRIPFFLGASAVLAGAVMLAIAVIGALYRQRPVRRRMLWSMLGASVFVVLAAVGMAVGALQARAKLDSGNQLLTDGFDQLRAGNTSAAADTLRRAADDLRDAEQALDGFWTQPSRLVPVVAQHRSLATDIVASAKTSAAAAAAALTVADVDQLRLVGGKLDVATLGLLAKPFADLDVAVRGLANAFDGGDSQWVIGAVRNELRKARTKIDAALVQTNAIAAVAEHGPGMLGTDGARRYLVVFTSPGQARGQSGVIDNYAEITITNGRIQQSGFGRTADLTADLAANDPLHLQISQEYLDRYGSFGAGSARTAVSSDFWTSVTMSPDTPSVGDVLRQMYAAAGHGDVDGVITVDPLGLAGLLAVAGPITLPVGDPPVAQTIDAPTLQQFLLFDQYTLDDALRRTVLEAAAGTTLRTFLSATLPGPEQLGSALGPAATEGHITWWVKRPDEQAVIQLIGMSGRLPAPSGSDGLAIVTNNAGGNAIDVFLHRSVTYTATYDPQTGDVAGDVFVTLRNDAPATGYADYVIGNARGLPSGTNHTMLSVYSPLDVGAVTVDGRAAPVTAGTELGWNTSTLIIDVARGQTRTVHMHVAGAIALGAYSFIWRAQPLTTPDVFSLDVADPADGQVVFSGAMTRTSIIDADGVRALR